MSWFSGKGRIDPGTGRNKRDKGPVTEIRGQRPERLNGKIVKGGRAEFQRARKTGAPVRSRWDWW